MNISLSYLMKKNLWAGLLTTVVGFASAVFFSSTASAACLTVDEMENAQGAGVYETCGGDDLSYRVPLAGNVIFGGIPYSSVYATTNSAVSFGRGDFTFFDFLSAPHISFQSWDWVEAVPGGAWAYDSDPQEHFIITTTESGFVVDLSGRQFPHVGGLITNILAFVRNPDSTLSIQSFSSSSDTLYRNGCRLGESTYSYLNPVELNPIVGFDACGITQQVSIEAITQFVEIIENNEIAAPPVEEVARAVEEPYIPDPIQQSRTDSITAFLDSDEAQIKITVEGNFIETVTAINANGKNVPDGLWIQDSTSVTFSVRKSHLSTYVVQIFNGSAPVVNEQSFTIII
jgi:hypothetical protein